MTPTGALYAFINQVDPIIVGQGFGSGRAKKLATDFSRANGFEESNRLNMVQSGGKCSLKDMTPEETLIAFITWLVSRPDSLTLELSPEVVLLIDKFCRINNLIPVETFMNPTPPRDDWGIRTDFKQELISLINKHSRENASDTPDFILAEYLMNCLVAFESATNRRTAWYDVGKKA